MSRTKRFYAVRVGREAGIYTEWSEARKQVDGFPKAEFKGFMLYNDAEAYLEVTDRDISETRIPEPGR